MAAPSPIAGWIRCLNGSLTSRGEAARRVYALVHTLAGLSAGDRAVILDLLAQEIREITTMEIREMTDLMED